MSNELDTIKIGKFIAEQRRALGLNQQGLADLLSVTNKAVSKWETGQGAPDIGTLTQLAEVLQVTVDEILKGEKAPQSPVTEQKNDSSDGKAAFITQTSLSRHNRLLCARACWQSWYTWLRLIYLSAGILLLVLAFAGAGVSHLTAYHISPAVIAFLAVAGAFFLALSVEGYRLVGMFRNYRAAEDNNCTFQFMENGFTIFKEGVTKSWSYEHVVRLLETGELFIILCGREIEFIKKQSLPAEEMDALVRYVRYRSPKADYRNLSGGRTERVAGLFLAGASLLLILLQAAYLVVHSRYQVEYQAEWIPYLINAVILAAAFFSCFFLTKRKKRILLIVGILCGLLFCLNIAGVIVVSKQTQDILSFSPDGKNELVLKRDTSTGKAVHYRYPFLCFVRPYEHFPYTVYGKVKTQWLTGDICAVTYSSEKDGPVHQYVATFGDRGRDDHYYVEASLEGSWEPSGKNTAGWRFVIDSDGIVLSNGSGEERYDAKDCVQYGLTTIVLCRDGLPQWTVALNEDCKIDKKTLLVSYGGTLTLCKVSMEPTAPIVLRSTSKSSVSSDGETQVVDTAEKYTYRIQNGVLSFTWDSGHRWTNVPLPDGGLKSILKPNSSTTLTSGCWHIADDASYLVYGRMPLMVLYSPDQGKTWQSHKVADIDSAIESSYICYTSIQTACVAIGADRVMGQEGTSLFFTKDGGISWQAGGSAPSTQILTGMNFLNQDIGYLSYSNMNGDSGELYETVDGGNSFTKITLPDGNLENSQGLTFQQVYDTPQVPHLENGIPVLYVSQGSDGDFEGGTLRARYVSKDGGKTWQYVSQEKPPANDIK
jgi:transcriptional regulator with XRE-family HTH domain